MGHSPKIISNGFAFPTEPTSPEANLAFSANDINARDVVHFRFLLPIICYAVQLDVDALPRSITFTWILNISALSVLIIMTFGNRLKIFTSDSPGG